MQKSNNTNIKNPDGSLSFIHGKVNSIKRKETLETLVKDFFTIARKNEHFNLVLAAFPELEMKIDEIMELIGR